MSRKSSWILVGGLCLCLVAALAFGVRQGAEADRIARQLESGYARRLMESVNILGHNSR